LNWRKVFDNLYTILSWNSYKNYALTRLTSFKKLIDWLIKETNNKFQKGARILTSSWMSFRLELHKLFLCMTKAKKHNCYKKLKKNVKTSPRNDTSNNKRKKPNRNSMLLKNWRRKEERHLLHQSQRIPKRHRPKCKKGKRFWCKR